MPCPRLAHFGAVREGRVTGLASSSSVWLFKPAPRRDMFSTLPHLLPGHPRPYTYGRCSSPICCTNVDPQSWLGARLNETRSESSKSSLASERVAKTNMLVG